MSAPLGNMTVEEFLREYWQKRPVVIRNAFPDFESPIEGDDLAGLSLDEQVLSRLILEKGGEYPWQLKTGPLKESDFEDLGDEHWTILVQEVDKHVPAVADLYDRFNFLPSWRKDDVMVSFAAKNAGVGAHIDSYDVFLLQGSGRRRWEIGEMVEGFQPDGGGIRANTRNKTFDDSRYIEGLDVRILSDFQVTESFELEPGDILYLPPGVPHNGVAIEPCLTFSFGFLAPTQGDMVSEFAEWKQEQHGPRRYRDADLTATPNPGLISSEDIRRLQKMMSIPDSELSDLARWFGRFITRPQRSPLAAEEFEGSFADFLADFQDSGIWRRHEALRLAVCLEAGDDLFCDGEFVTHELDQETLLQLARQREFRFEESQSNEALQRLLHQFTENAWAYLIGDENG